MKRLLKVMSVFAVILIACMAMVACSSTGETNKPETPTVVDTNFGNIDNFGGFYANFETRLVYYVDGDNFELAEFSINNTPNENGQYRAQLTDRNTSGFKFKKTYGTKGASVYIVLDEEDAARKIRDHEFFIGTANRPEQNKDLSKQFYSESDQKVYSKFSSLTEMFAEAFPDEPIDPTNVSWIADAWKDLFLAA